MHYMTSFRGGEVWGDVEEYQVVGVGAVGGRSRAAAIPVTGSALVATKRSMPMCIRSC